ncbi:MAG: restriction endonuclease subunit S, partial [Acidimicrobiia bacterium]|nr:restriction endonuclease subunit S [Acidimicrobiia bacterium]
ADFLDAETARIDALITKKRALSDRLLERRNALTLDGVAGTLTSPAEGRASTGLPWLPSYPEGWQTTKLTLIARLGSGHTPSRDHPEWWEDCTIPWVTTGEVAQMRGDRIEYIATTREKISELGMAHSSATLHPAGTVVLSRTASAGFSAIMGTDMATSQDFATWTCGPLLDSRFLLLCLRAMRSDLLGRLTQGSTHQTIYMPDIEAIRIPLPPLDEQHRIVEATWASLGPIDRAVDVLEKQIALLRERRQALITAAVTGEIAVPGTAA